MGAYARLARGLILAALAWPASWYQLLDILKHRAQEFEFYASRPPLSCPKCGEPLINTPSSDAGVTDELYCRYDGWRYPRDYIRPEPL